MLSQGPSLTVLQLLLGQHQDVPALGAAAWSGGGCGVGPLHHPCLHIGVAMEKK